MSVCAVLVGVLTMTSDVFFSLAVERLPKQLASAMAQNGLLSPAILRYYPRKSAEELGLAPAQGVKMRKVLEGTTAIAAIGLGTIGMVGIGALIDGGATCMETDVAGTASRQWLHDERRFSGALDSTTNGESREDHSTGACFGVVR